MRMLRSNFQLTALLTLLAAFAFAVPAAAASAAQPNMSAMPATSPHCHDCAAYCLAVSSAQTHAPLPTAAKVPPFAAVTASKLFVVVPTASAAYWPTPPQSVRPPTVPVYLQHCTFLK
jgi:hypothetical protein